MAKKSKMMKIVQSDEQTVYVLVYIRVSTDRQAEEGYSIEIQRERLTAYVKSMFGDKDVVVQFFVDDGYSGGNLDRPGIQSLIETVQQGVGTHVIVYKLDRLSRSQKDTLYLIEDVFLANNVAFISMQESFNTATAFGRAVVGILSVFAQLERENIFERTRSGRLKRVEAGYWPGGGGVPFGYNYDQSKGILVPNKDADTVRAVYDLYIDQNMSLQHIANVLGLKYDRFAMQILTRKTNAGYLVYNGVEYKGLHEAIVPLERYEQAMAIFNARSEAKTYHTSKATHLLAGLVVCGECGAKMRYIPWGKKGQYNLMCYSHVKSKPYLVKDPNCPSPYYKAGPIEDTVIQDLFHVAQGKKKTQQQATEKARKKKTLEDTLQERKLSLTAKLKRLYQLYSDSTDEVLIDEIDDVKEQLAQVKEQLENEEAKQALLMNEDRARENIQTLMESWNLLSDTKKHRVLESVIERIVLKDGKANIFYKF